MTAVSLQPDNATLCQMLTAARERTLAYAASLQGEQWLGPYLSIVNPPLWELGHLGWFQEHWCLRYRADGTLAPSRLSGADALYNSAIVPHAARWHLALPEPAQTLMYLRDVLDAVMARLSGWAVETDAALVYFAQLATFHEEMHNEAFDYTGQTLSYPSHKIQLNQSVTNYPCVGDACVSGGQFVLGAVPGDGFVFDNEKWAHEVSVLPFQMARTAVSNAEFAAFVDDGGYARRELWRDVGWQWRNAAGAGAPVYWKRAGSTWTVRQQDRWLPLQPGAAVNHVNWFEAEAYCRWARRRLPTEAEWEFAASTEPGNLAVKRRYPWGNAPPAAHHANLYGVAGQTVDASAFPDGDSAWGVRQMFGNVWEWTADWFNPFPGFMRDPYQEYSEPWFGNHKVLRGGCYATRATLLRNTWRNFYTPDRRDVLAGFRTCAMD